MSRPRGYAEQAAKTDFVKELQKCMVDAGIESKKSLAGMIPMDQRTLCRRFEDIGEMKVAELAQIVQILNPDPFVLLRCCGVSAKTIAKIREGIDK